MASPTLETVCCAYDPHHPSVESILHFDIVPYNIVCLISGCLGICGAIYQILPYVDHGHGRRGSFSGLRQRNFIYWLAISDLMATAGILIRSISWISDVTIMPIYNAKHDGNIFCAAISVWIHFFYCATYFWTILYAIDVYFTTRQRPSSPLVYHSVCWGLSFLFTCGGMVTLYVPHMTCHMEFRSVFANYLLTYLPIFVAMLVNPVFLYLSSREVEFLLTTRCGQFSDQERGLLKVLKEKFFFIVFVFYSCWIPNIINGVLLWSMWGNLPRRLLITLWYMMAVLNPLQALLNSLVYRGWDFCGNTCVNLCCPVVEEADSPISDSESAPVLSNSSSTLSRSTYSNSE